MNKTILAGLTYFAMVMGAGFMLGVIRVPFLVPRLGERWAELAEMPIMAVVIFTAAGYVLRRFPAIRSAGRAWTAGCLALALSLCAELGLALVLQSQTLADFIQSRDKVSGAVYLALLLVFAAMPRLRLARMLRP
jgi:endonuclease/exonuclease/phosphatase (EEP) superfamily protein YafD